MNIQSIEKRIKEGGAYVHSDISMEISRAQAFQEIDKSFTDNLTFFHMASRPARVHHVLGLPLSEDLDARIPSHILRVKFEGPRGLSEDNVYRLFRRYGHIYDVKVKDEDKSVIVTFRRPEAAVAARNCLHGAKIDLAVIAAGKSPYSAISAPDDSCTNDLIAPAASPSLKSNPEFVTVVTSYVSAQRMSFIKDQFAKHPRIFFPLAGLLGLLLTYILFDPLRAFLIQRNMDEVVKDKSSRDQLMPHDARIHEEAKLSSIIRRAPKAITVLAAPKGSGKSTLVNTVLKSRHGVLTIDFAALSEGGDADLIDFIADTVGYFPNFAFLSQLAGYVDMILPISKGALNWSAHAQLQSIFSSVKDALKRERASLLKRGSEDYPIIVLDGLLEHLRGMEDKEEADALLNCVLRFSVSVTQKKHVAHVLIVSGDYFASETIRKWGQAHYGGIKVDTVRIGDISEESALQYMRASLSATRGIVEEDLKFTYSQLGGRLQDLESWMYKVVSGARPRDACMQMVQAAVSEVRTEGFGLTKGKLLVKEQKPKQVKDAKWTTIQLWKTIKRIAEADHITYDDLLFNTLSGNRTALNAILNSNLVRLTPSCTNGGAYDACITAASPLLRSAFISMMNDKQLSQGFDAEILRDRISHETHKLHAIEDELLKLKSLSQKTGWIHHYYDERTKDLQEKLRSTAALIHKLEAELHHKIKT